MSSSMVVSEVMQLAAKSSCLGQHLIQNPFFVGVPRCHLEIGGS